MFLSLCYVVLRRVLQLGALRFRSTDSKDLEIVVLRHELAILRRGTRRPAITLTDRLFPGGGQSVAAARTLAVLHHHTGDAASLASAVSGEAVEVRASSRAPPIRREIQLVVRFVQDNPRWSYQRIVGELKGLGTAVSATTVRTWL